MALHDVAMDFFTFDSRIASFQTAKPLAGRRTSNASAKAPKSIKWPHKFLEPEQLAKAGFFYHPSQTNPDNCVCFLCHKSIDAWEEGDDPLVEHLKHSPDCGWAIVTTIESQDGELSQQYPASAEMIEARKATFAGQWPHDSKKGWKCKTKQLVDAGWKYTPTPESDDMATCTYCSLALDGWEPSDKPLEEHFNRSPDCPFFTLVEQFKASAKKGKAKKGRPSKASRTSTQSVNDNSMLDSTMLDNTILDNSILDTTIIGEPQTKPAKRGRAAKSSRTSTQSVMEVSILEEPQPKPARKGRATKASRASVQSSNTTANITAAVVEEDQPKPPTKKPRATKAARESNQSMASSTTGMKPRATRGRKRKSEDVEDNIEISVPAPTASRLSTQSALPNNAIDTGKATDGEVSQSEDAQNDMEPPEAPTVTTITDDLAIPTPKAPRLSTQSVASAASNTTNTTNATTKTKSTRGRKRKSDDMDNDLQMPILPPPKRTARSVSSRLASKASVAPLRAPSPEERVPSLSPQSPHSSQSSDAENHPPSSRPSLQRPATPQTVKRTPLKSSPSKRNIIAGPQSTIPWEEIDIDTIFIADENEYERTAFGLALDKLKNGELPEKKMTVEEFIYHTAAIAEEKLKEECERMVGEFERQGMKALACLEAIEVI